MKRHWVLLAQSRLAGFALPAMAFAATLVVGTPASALVIDFESIATGACVSAGTSFTTQGFTFSTGAFTFFSCDGTRTDLASNGTITVGSENPTVTTMTKSGGEAFSVQSIDLGELFTSETGSHQVRITGDLSGGGTVSATVDLDNINDGSGGVADFQTFSLPSSFDNLQSLVLAGTLPLEDPRFMFDNIVVGAGELSPVPEPSTALLLGSALTGVLAHARWWSRDRGRKGGRQTGG